VIPFPSNCLHSQSYITHSLHDFNMTAKAVQFETGHEEMIHDAQLDYYGKRLATCSSDRSIRIFDVHSSNAQTLTSQIRGHEGPVWAVGWAHPKFGSILASASYDSRVCVWKETAANNWTKIYEYTRPDASMNTLAWAPHTFGLVLALGAADGTVSVLSRKQDNTWDVQTFMAHKGGVNAVSWGPDVKTGALLSAGGSTHFERRLVSGGCDNQIRMWRFAEDAAASQQGGVGAWQELRVFGDEPCHSDWVRDVAWAPSLGLPANTIASASEDRSVVIWVEDASSGGWKRSKTLRFDAKIYKLSWSLMGNILAVAQGDNKVSLWKESIDGDWKSLSQPQAMEYMQQQQQPAPSPSQQVPSPHQHPSQTSPHHTQQQQQQQQHPPMPQQPQQQQPQYSQQYQQAPPAAGQYAYPQQQQQQQQPQYGQPHMQPHQQQPQYGQQQYQQFRQY